MPYTDRFGFLNHPKKIDFGYGHMTPCAEFADGLLTVQRDEHIDGFMYPPLSRTHRLSIDGSPQSVPLPNTSRPAPVFDMPMSHDLLIAAPVSNTDNRHEDGGLIVHLTAFFFGTRLQFEGWRFDGPVPTKPVNSFLYADDTPSHFIEWAYGKWRTWTPSLRRRYTNIVYMHTRAVSCGWEWDRFMYRYMVFDAICKFHQELEGTKFTSHADRITEMCRRYDIARDADTIKSIVRLRNELFHEALWDGTTPGQRVGNNFSTEKWLGNLNAKLIVATTGYTNAFTRRGWWFFGWQPFDKYIGSSE